VADEPSDEPDDEHDGNSEDEPECGDKDAEEDPVATCMAAGLGEVAREQSIVAAVRLPDDVEDVAEEWNGANEYPNANIGGHAQECDVWDAANPGGNGDDEREESGEDVAEAGNKANYAVDAEAEVRSGDTKCFVEKGFEGLER